MALWFSWNSAANNAVQKKWKKPEGDSSASSQVSLSIHIHLWETASAQGNMQCGPEEGERAVGGGGAEAETNEVKDVAYKNSVYRDPQNTREYDLTGGSPRQRVLQSAQRLSNTTSLACTARCDTRIYRQDTHWPESSVRALDLTQTRIFKTPQLLEQNGKSCPPLKKKNK